MEQKTSQTEVGKVCPDLGIEKVLEENSSKKISGLVEMQKYFMKHPFYEKARRAKESKESES